MGDRVPTVAVIAPDGARAARLEEGLRGSGIEGVAVIADGAGLEPRALLARLEAIDPQAVVIALEDPGRELWERMLAACRALERPVALFVDRSEPAMTRAALDAGIAAYVVDGLEPGRVRSVVEVAMLRFEAVGRLRRELADAKGALAERKLVERAKGVLMKAKRLSEEEAYALLRRQAMNEKRKIIDIAQAVITSAELLA
jgi:two-component system, response regulator / RNA-binding antiterminator